MAIPNPGFAQQWLVTPAGWQPVDARIARPVSCPHALAVGLLLPGAFPVVGIWEIGWWLRRLARRGSVYREASVRAKETRKPLVVIGAPDGGWTSGYGCGDVTVDLAGSACPVSLRKDVTQRLPFADASVCVFCSCVLEYVDNPDAAVKEIARVSGGDAFYVGVEPWTLTGMGLIYPGQKWSLAHAYR
jgi:SAM-dependent methyltransferase